MEADSATKEKVLEFFVNQRLERQSYSDAPDAFIERWQSIFDGIAITRALLGEVVDFAEELQINEGDLEIFCEKIGIEPLNDEDPRTAGISIMLRFIIEDVQSFIDQVNSAQVLLDKIEAVDEEELEQNRLKFGNKGANLIALRTFAEKYGQMFGEIDVVVPDFELVPVDVYKKWKGGEDVKSDLQDFFKKVKGREIYVRSSAVYSEDSECTGAGIYHSEKIFCYTFDDLYSAVIRVFESVDSKKAIAYRAENGVEEEFMGVVLQDYVELSQPSHHSAKGYLNTHTAFSENLMDLTLFKSDDSDPVRPVFIKNVLRRFLAYEAAEEKVFYYPFDKARFSPTVAFKLARIGYVLEHYYGKSMQIEFVENNGLTVNIVQARQLPESFMHVQEGDEDEFNAITENQEDSEGNELLFTGKCVGGGTHVHDVLIQEAGNNSREGIVLFDYSFGKSTSSKYLINYFPKNGFIIVSAKSEQFSGHLETLALEKGLGIIFETNKHAEFAIGPYKKIKIVAYNGWAHVLGIE